MNKPILLFCILLSFTTLKAQDLNPVDAKIMQYPKTFGEAKELADLINNDFDNDTDKARAIYTWITTNVRFDVDAHFNRKKKKSIRYKNKVDRARKLRNRRIQIENKALQEHLALAEGYATLYKTLCDLTGIYGYLLNGTAKLRTFDIGKQPKIINHYWNVIQIEKEWFFVDAALGAGSVDYSEKTYHPWFNPKYFFTPREKFFLNHYPKDEGWTLVQKTADDFAKLPLLTGEYLRNDFELIEPSEGVLDLKGQDSIHFEIKSPIPLDKLTYQFNYEKEPSEIQAIEDKGTYSFDIPFTTKRRGYLNIYYSNRVIISYKINTY